MMLNVKMLATWQQINRPEAAALDHLHRTPFIPACCCSSVLAGSRHLPSSQKLTRCGPLWLKPLFLSLEFTLTLSSAKARPPAELRSGVQRKHFVPG